MADKKEFRYDSNKMSDEVKKTVFKLRNEFAKVVHGNQKRKHTLELYTVDTMSEAYDSSHEVLNLLLESLQNQSQKRFDKHIMELKTSVSVNRVNEGYQVVAQYR